MDQLTDFIKTYQFKIKNNIDTVDSHKELVNGDSVLVYSVSMGHDGITVRGTFDQNNVFKKFQFWSPDKGTENEKFIKILFSILYHAYQDEKSINYFEQLEQYFPHELGLKKVSDDPLKYKLYGDIDSDNESQLESFFESLPHDKKVFIDMSNFLGMGTMYDSIIEDYVKENKRLYWINPTDQGLIHLYEIGVRNSHIISKRKIVKVKEIDGKKKITYKDY